MSRILDKQNKLPEIINQFNVPIENIAYVGVIAALIKIDLDIIKTLLEETFASKKHLAASNLDTQNIR